MRKGGGLLGRYETTQQFGCGAMVKCLFCAIVLLSVLNPAVLPDFIFQRSEVYTSASHSTENQETTELQKPKENLSVTKIDVWIQPNHTEEKIKKEIEPLSKLAGTDISMPTFDSEEKQYEKEPEGPVEKESPTGSDGPDQSSQIKHTEEMIPSVSFNVLEKPGARNSMKESDEKQCSPSNEKTQESGPAATEVIVKESKLIYNSANPRYNICSIEGDIRIVPNASTIFMVSPTPLNPNTTTWKIRPYPRKWEASTMEAITEMTIQQLTDANQARSCDVTHDLPAVVFSTARFIGNLFHDYTDMIYPLFLATHRYNREVKLVVEDYTSETIEKYRPYLTRLSHYPIINLDNETRVHCFSSAQVGLQNPGPLGYMYQHPQNDQAMQQFTHFIRESLYLGRSEVKRGKKPRLLILLRKISRSIINEDDVINLAKDVGFEVITADEETTKDFPRIAHIVNSCDVLMGIHGAGLANMIYLPTNGTVFQITPFGWLKWVGRYDYGEPPRGFGLRYVEYEITLEESNLIEKYPRDHPVLTDPQSIHRKGWHEVYVVYLWEQSVKLGLERFRGSLEEAFQLYQ